MASCLSRAASGKDDGSEFPPRLYLITYMVPGRPLELYQTFQNFLEKVLDCESRLIVESRWSTPPAGKPDPFISNEVDLGFMCSTGYVRLIDEKNPSIELLPVSPIHIHPEIDRTPVYYSDVIVRKDKATIFKEFKDLKGHTLGINDVYSLSGNFSVLSELKRLGYNASFFGNIVETGAHVNSVDAIVGGGIDCAAIDCLSLRMMIKKRPALEDEIHVVTSLGPFPAPPIIVNKRLPADIKTKIVEALSNIDKYPEFAEKFRECGVKDFGPVDPLFFNRTRELMETTKNEKLFPAYY